MLLSLLLSQERACPKNFEGPRSKIIKRVPGHGHPFLNLIEDLIDINIILKGLEWTSMPWTSISHLIEAAQTQTQRNHLS